MHLTVILDMAASAHPERACITAEDGDIAVADLAASAQRLADSVQEGAGVLAFLGENGPAFAVSLFAAALAGIPFVPLNYRLAQPQLLAAIARLDKPEFVVDRRYKDLLPDEHQTHPSEDVVVQAAKGFTLSVAADADPEDPAVYLFTSGTTAEPKMAVLRHKHLTAYLLASLDFAAADEDEAALVCVPPYHVAGIANLLSNVFTGRRIVYRTKFDAIRWLDAVRAERVTHAMVVPTMLASVIARLEAEGDGCPSLRALSYGGSRTPVDLIRRTMAVLPDVGLVNAYGLTETSSSLAVLGPEDHRDAATSSDPVVNARLGSVGRPLPGVEVEVRDVHGQAVSAGRHGLVWVSGDQISGEYKSVAGGDGWFCTRDEGWLDEDGYLFVVGRSDDTIIRGGENIAPAEVEDCLLAHPDVVDACVAGVPDPNWGQRVGAVVVMRPGSSATAQDLVEYTAVHLRRSRSAEVVVLADALPMTDTGKVLRRSVQAVLADSAGASV